MNLHYSLNGISILFIMMLVKTSYDYVWILNMWVILILTLSRATEQFCATAAILKPLCLSKPSTLLW